MSNDTTETTNQSGSRGRLLTPYDTGQLLEPKPWVPWHSYSPSEQQDELRKQSLDGRWGKVDFDDDEGGTVATVHAERQGDGHYKLIVEGSIAIESKDWDLEGTSPVEAPASLGPVEAILPVITTDGTPYTDQEGLISLLTAWREQAPAERAWVQEGDDEDAALAITWQRGDGTPGLELRRFDTEIDALTGCGWSLHGLPFEYEAEAVA